MDKSGLSTGAKIGIGIGVAAVAIALIAAVLALIVRKRAALRKKSRANEMAETEYEKVGPPLYPPVEVNGDVERTELEARKRDPELPADEIHELSSGVPLVEGKDDKESPHTAQE